LFALLMLGSKILTEYKKSGRHLCKADDEVCGHVSGHNEWKIWDTWILPVSRKYSRSPGNPKRMSLCASGCTPMLQLKFFIGSCGAEK
jgi:hypothetical protein